MPTIHLSAEVTSGELLKAVEQLPPREFAKFLGGVNALRARRQASSLSGAEAELLKRINQGFTEAWWDRYHQMIEKRCNEALSEKERTELIKLTDQIEKKEAKRLAALVELAKLRGKSLRDQMRELGLPVESDA